MSTEDLYVAKCTRTFPSSAAGVAHERECPDCRDTIDGWCETYSNVTALGRWLVDEKQFDAEALQAFYEKPWKWDNEYREMLEAQC